MTPNSTYFQQIYSYGLMVLWVSVSVILIPSYIIAAWPELLNSIVLALGALVMLTIFGMPIAAIASFVIGGGIWKIFKRIIPNHSIRAGLAGGVTGASVMSLLLFYTFKPHLMESLITVFAVCLLGVWCGWVGERLADSGLKAALK